jgi:hypothetical protein
MNDRYVHCYITSSLDNLVLGTLAIIHSGIVPMDSLKDNLTYWSCKCYPTQILYKKIIDLRQHFKINYITEDRYLRCLHSDYFVTAEK